MASLTETELALLEADLPPLKKSQLAGGGTIAYREAGSDAAPAIIFLHGIGGSSASYRAQFAGLAHAWRTIAWDAPGYGESTRLPQAAPSVSHYSDRLLEFADALGIERFHLAATSWGTLIAADFTGRYPNRVYSLTLSGASIGTAPMAQEEREPILQARLKRDAEGLMGRAPSNLVAEDAPPAVIELLAALRSSMRPEGYEQATRMLLAADARTLYKHIRRPTLFAVGDVDKVCPPQAHALKLHREVEGSLVQVFEGCGHILELEAPHRFNAHLERFISDAARDRQPR